MFHSLSFVSVMLTNKYVTLLKICIRCVDKTNMLLALSFVSVMLTNKYVTLLKLCIRYVDKQICYSVHCVQLCGQTLAWTHCIRSCGQMLSSSHFYLFYGQTNNKNSNLQLIPRHIILSNVELCHIFHFCSFCP